MAVETLVLAPFEIEFSEPSPPPMERSPAPRATIQPTDRPPHASVEAGALSPVFVDASGRRRRQLRAVSYGLGAACTAYVALLVLSVSAGAVGPVGAIPFAGLGGGVLGGASAAGAAVDEALTGTPAGGSTLAGGDGLGQNFAWPTTPGAATQAVIGPPAPGAPAVGGPTGDAPGETGVPDAEGDPTSPDQPGTPGDAAPGDGTAPLDGAAPGEEPVTVPEAPGGGGNAPEPTVPEVTVPEAPAPQEPGGGGPTLPEVTVPDVVTPLVDVVDDVGGVLDNDDE